MRFLSDRGARNQKTTLKYLSGYAFTEEEEKGCPSSSASGKEWWANALWKRSASWLPAFPMNTSRSAQVLAARLRPASWWLPVLFEGEARAVIELASFSQFSEVHLASLTLLTRIHRHRAEHHRGHDAYEELLISNRKRWRKTTEPAAVQFADDQRRVAGKAQLLAEQKPKWRPRIAKGRAAAKQQLEEKAEQLALTSKYKSEFLANMSHELRTPAQQPAHSGENAG